jgi:hypothetical protein
MTWAELHLKSNGSAVLVHPDAVRVVWESEWTEPEDGGTVVMLSTGERIVVAESYKRISALLHEAAQASVAA